MSILKVNGLTKVYGGAIKALDNVSFEVPQGAVFGILGPNGSGKTTLLGIVMDVLKATEGSYAWFNEPGSAEQRRQIGTLLETPNFYHYLSGERNLKITAAIKQKGDADIDRVLDIVNLSARRHSKFSTYSLGMKQRLAIAAALLGDPGVLVFDEPTNGLDPAGIAEIRELIKTLNRQGKTIIMASHILDEVEKVCTHVAIIQKGVLKTTGTVAQLMNHDADNTIVQEQQAATITIEVGADNLTQLAALLQQYPNVVQVTETDDRLSVEIADNTGTAALNKYCFDNGITLSYLLQKKKTLETRFLEITGTKSEK